MMPKPLKTDPPISHENLVRLLKKTRLDLYNAMVDIDELITHVEVRGVESRKHVLNRLRTILKTKK
jgi:hypothetical protein